MNMTSWPTLPMWKTSSSFWMMTSQIFVPNHQRMWPKWWWKLWKIQSAGIWGQPRAPPSHWMMISWPSLRQKRSDSVCISWQDVYVWDMWHVSTCMELMAESHQHTADVMYSVKKLIPIIPAGAFQLIMQGILQPVIKLKGQCVWCINPSQRSKQMSSFNDIIPDGSAAHDPPQAVRTLATAVVHLIKVEYGFKASIMGKSKLFDVQEKCLRQGLKAVKYQGRSQHKWQKDHA